MEKKLLLVAIGSIGIVLFFSWVIHIIDNDLATGAWAFGIACGLFIHIGSGAIACLIKDSNWFKSRFHKLPNIKSKVMK